MFISEIYQSNQGEGRLTSTPSVFVRTSGCNLRCGFCDTPFASWHPEGQTLEVAEVIESTLANAMGSQHVVITGGEPMLPEDIESLCDGLHKANFHITIETAGTIYRNLKCDLMSISPKLSNSTPQLDRAGRWREKHESQRHRPKIVSRLIAEYDYQMKFVVADPNDLQEINAYLDQIKNVDRTRVLLMPEGIDARTLNRRTQWMKEVCQREGFTFCQRQHIFWYGNKRGT